ncbi:hypothetical protein BGW39_008419 [Mortierella sp. 14UC]|nr:hypothetical protein BGW39_008419 [Mortierella sp. 14UC]
MRTRIIATTEDATFVAPVKEPVAGWSVRPGTFRVAQPYDKPIPIPSNTSSTAATHPSEPGRPHKKQKLSTQGSDNDEEITQWIQSTLQLLLEKDATRTHINAIQQDEFFGTFVDAPANEEFTLDLVKAQPTLQLLRYGFQSTSSKRRRDQTDNDAFVPFDEVLLGPGNQQQQLEMTDVYETLKGNHYIWFRPARRSSRLTLAVYKVWKPSRARVEDLT